MVKLLQVLRVMLTVVYPVAIYLGLSRYSARTVGLLMLVVLGPSLVSKVRLAKREDLWAVLPLPVGVLSLVVLSAALNDRRFVMAMPVLISLVFLHSFGTSLRTVPMVERFARMQDGDLTEDKVAYCRRVTVVWCAFFAFNAALSAALALAAPLEAWTLYTGLIAYVLIGIVGGVEYTVRKYRFREYGPHFHDRLLSRLFPPPKESP